MSDYTVHGPYSFNEHFLDEARDKQGCYILIKITVDSYEFVYVGSSDNIEVALQEHLKDPKIEAHQYLFMEEDDEDYQSYLENDLYNRFEKAWHSLEYHETKPKQTEGIVPNPGANYRSTAKRIMNAINRT